MQKGMNERYKKYWKDEIFIKLHLLSEPEADIRADIVCQGEEIKKLKERIIKLEKKLKQ